MSFDPAPGPATTKSVFALTLPAALAPSRSACALATSRLITNVLAGPLIELAPAFAKACAPGASVVLAGLLDTQADAVIAAYEAEGMTVTERGEGECCVLVLASSK